MDPIQAGLLKDALGAAQARGGNRQGTAELGKEFGKLFDSLLGNANVMQQEAKGAVDGLLTGEVTDIHQVMVAVNKAELSFKFLVEVRNKLTEAYKELMSGR